MSFDRVLTEVAVAKDRLVADFDAAETPGVSVPETLANETAGRRRGRFFNINRSAVSRTARGNGATDNRAADDSTSHGCAEAALCACGCRSQRTSDRSNRNEGS
jgi:hypothetical protein